MAACLKRVWTTKVKNIVAQKKVNERKYDIITMPVSRQYWNYKVRRDAAQEPSKVKKRGFRDTPNKISG